MGRLNETFNDTEILLQAIGIEMKRGGFRQARMRRHPVGWGGADVVFTTREPRRNPGPRFYPDPRTVVTPYALEAGWLLRRLWQTFRLHLDSCSKIEFFGRVANAALLYQEKLEGHDEKVGDLLKAIMSEAFVIFEEMKRGEFRCLGIALGNTIYADIKRMNEGR
ncbi:hypothetical protein ACFL27_28425 [candidate division CSSED10-310 bacterium]|uniref:Uncharacterized protein n=1 Tax=candidate division CSSED10-310 bacterium TaxID=2855610 RepID=A0ABV6Z712_UNCC1